jgi:large subunit ribosomal protein L29
MATTEKIKASDLRQKTKKELQVMLEERSQELMNLRFQKAVARLEKPSRISALKRERARILTVMREKAQ